MIKYFKMAVKKFLICFGNTKYQKFVIITRSRTGSNLLCSMLNSSRRIVALGEQFRHLDGARWKDRLDASFGRRPFFVKAVGFKVFYYHPIDAKCPDFWEHLEENKKLKIIHLCRTNLLAAAVSKKVAEETDRWLQPTDSSVQCDKSINPKPLVSFTPIELEEIFETITAYETKARERFKTHEFLEITYEQLSMNPRTVCDHVADFIGVKPTNWQIRLSKQESRPLEHSIENFGELTKYFANSRWSSFF